MGARREVLAALGDRYLSARRQEKDRILDEGVLSSRDPRDRA